MPKRSILYIIIPLLTVSCSPTYTRYIQDYASPDTSKIPDYSHLASWAAHPWKKDLSDSIPPGFSKSYLPDTTVDVFFIHPTTLTSGKSAEWNAGIHDATINAKTDYGSILYQASVFNNYRVFAPRYRQAHLRSYFTTDTANAKKAFALAYHDVRSAFQYYLRHYNNGRPVIIASHSQGTSHALNLIEEFFQQPALKDKLVAAYLIGMYIPKNYTGLTPCKDSTQTGCLIGWRTYQKEYIPEYVVKENGNALITNPLNWTLNEDYVPPAFNSASVLRNFNKLYTHVTGAQIHNGILWIEKPRFPGSFLLKMKNYHIADINLFYGNIRHNLTTRINEFRKNTDTIF